jgi:hypothetical protein
MPNRVVLADACFSSAIGNTPELALQSLRSGRSGIRRFEDFPTAALLPRDGEPRALHPRLSERFASAVSGFCGRLRQLVTRSKPIDKLVLVCKIPFFSKFQHPKLAGWDEHEFVRGLLDLAGIDLRPDRVVLLQAACSTGTVGLNLVIRELARGDARRLLLLGIESELNAEKFLAYKKLGALSQESDPARSCQPFGSERSGLVPGEAAVALLLESRAAEIGEVVLEAGQTTADAFRLTDGLESGEFLTRCLEKTVAGRHLEDIDFVCPHGTSTPLNDRIEGDVLNRVFATRAQPIPVVPLKQYLGHTLNSSGLLETALCAELLRVGFLPPLLSHSPAGEYPHLRFLPRAEAMPLGRALKVSIGFGGLNSALLLEKVR